MQTYYKVLHGKQNNNEESNKKVIDALKKYNRNMLILKIIVIILSIFIISIWGNFIAGYVKNEIKQKEDFEKGQYIYGVIDKAYCKINEMTDSNNYSVVREEISISHDLQCIYNYSKTETLYKDGYFKEVNTFDSGSMKREGLEDYTNYGVVGKDRTFSIQLHDKDSNPGGFSSKEGKIVNNILDGYHDEDALEYRDYDIREEEFNKVVYYVINKKENKDDGVHYTEIWINKENKQLFKVTKEKLGCNKSEVKFIISEGNVKDEDVQISFLGDNEKIQELSKTFEKINNGESENDYQEMEKWSVNNFNSKISFDNYIKTNKKIVMPMEAMDIAMNVYETEVGNGYAYKGIVFDQNLNAYYVYRQDKAINEGIFIQNVFIQNIFVSVFGDIIKTNDINMEFNNGDLIVL